MNSEYSNSEPIKLSNSLNTIFCHLTKMKIRFPDRLSRKLSETVRDHTYLIVTSQTSTRGPIVGHSAQNFDAQKVFPIVS